MLAAVTDGLPALLFGLPRPLIWGGLFVAVAHTPLLSTLGRRLMLSGLGLITFASFVFLFRNADIEIPKVLLEITEITSVPATALFASGLVLELGRLGGLGRH